MTTTVGEVIPLLLAAAPGFARAWTDHVAYWKDEPRGIYTDAAAFAHYLVRKQKAGDTTEFPAVFGEIERIVKDGDKEARAAVVVGVLEDVQTIASGDPVAIAAFQQHLGPLSQTAWREIDRLWAAGGGSLAGVVRVEASTNRSDEGE